ncbi:MAG: outer membrane protein [Candidatus Eiseniibacteriota bacterium]
MRRRWALVALAVMAVFIPASKAVADVEPGKGSIGGVIGIPFILADEDTKEGSSPRILGQIDFQYVFSKQTRLSFQFGYGWVGYKDGTPAPYKMPSSSGDSTDVKDDVLTKFQPITASLLHAFKPQGQGWVPYAGGGVNLTRMEIVNDRIKVQDPATFKDWVNWSLGVQARAGIEYFLPSNTNVSFDWSGRWAYQFSKSEDDLPSGYTNNDSYFTLNFGVNVYFWPIGHKPVETAPDAPAEGAAPAPESRPDAPAPEPAPVDTLTPPPPPPPNGASSSVLNRKSGSAPATSAAPAASTAIAKSAPAPSTTPSKTSAPKPERDESEDEGASCPVYDLGPMIGVPSSPSRPPAKTEEDRITP